MPKFRLWAIAGIIVAVFGSMYGSYLVTKERERLIATTQNSNDILKLIDSRIGSEAETNVKISSELINILDQQKVALENHEKIIAQLKERSDTIITNQNKIIQLLQSK